jgi:hypothetical protein
MNELKTSSLSIVHQLDGRSGSVRQDGLGLLHRAVLDRLICHVIDDDSGHAALLLRLVDQGRGSRACTAWESGVKRSHRRVLVLVHRPGAVVQLSERISKILSVDQLVGRIFKTHLPTVGRARWGRNEEELASIRKSEMLVSLVDWSGHAKVDTALLAHDSLVIPDLADGDGGLLVIERDDDAAERL